MSLLLRLTKPTLVAAVTLVLLATLSAFAAPGDTVADRVLGQPNLTSNTANNGGISASSLSQPSGVAVDGAGHLYVTDAANNRMLEYDSPLTSPVANRVFGQPNFTTNDSNHGGISASSLNAPYGVAVDSAGHLYVGDSANNRVLEYDSPLTSPVANRVFGQPNFTTFTTYGSAGPGGLSAPGALAVDGAGRLYVSDQNNSRVLEYDSPLASQNANRVFGQAGSFTTRACNGGGASASTLCLPGDVAVDAAGHLYIADLWNSRVLEYDSPLTSQSANRVFGQGGSFTTAVSNNGGVSADSLNFAFGVMLDAGGHLYIGDTQNNRILEYDSPLTSQTANRVFGQPNFTSNTANNGGIGPSTLNFPAPLAKDSAGDIYAVDAFNHRVLEYDLAPVPPVVELVHGYDSNADAKNCGIGIDTLENWLETPTNTGGTQFNTNCLIYRTREGVASGASDLWQSILRVEQYRHVDHVDIVAHSEGGLVARYCIQFLPGCSSAVRSLTMIGTPNLGSKRGDQACFFKGDQGACDLRPNSPLLQKLNASPGPPQGVAYHVLMGNQSTVDAYFGGANDCMVSVDSAFGLGFSHDPPFAASHVGGSGGAAWLGCNDPGELDDTSIRDRVSQLLLASNPLTSSASRLAAVAASSPPLVDAELASRSGVVSPASVVELPVVVPAGETSAGFVFRSPSNLASPLTFALLRPGPLALQVAPTDSDVTFGTGAGLGAIDETHYTLASPTAGTWTMRVTGTTVPLEGWQYEMDAAVPGDISVTAEAGEGHYDVGQPIALSADVAVNATPYAGATVNATITKPDNTTATVALTDVGGGTYTGSFGDTAACGLYQVTATAVGSDGGTPFSRQDRTIAFVGVPGNVIMDPCTADSDGDGITDSDEINIHHTNPGNADTDGDGYTDKQEIDMGKDPSTYCNIMRADVDHDGAVSILDLAKLAQYFTQAIPPAPTAYDQDGDNKISILDLARMAQVFTQPVSTCP